MGTDVAVFCRNEQARIGRCLEGLRAQAEALQDARRPLRAVVLENGSTDRSAEVATERGAALAVPGTFEVDVRAGLPAGKARAWNTFLESAGTDVVGFVDGDVLLSDGLLGRLIDRLESDPTLALAAAVPSLPPDFRPRGFWQDVFAVPYRHLRPAPSIVGNAYVARRAALTPLPTDAINEDLVLSLRHAGAYAICDQVPVFVEPPEGLGAFMRQRARIRRGDAIERARSGTPVAPHRRRGLADIRAYCAAAGALKLVAFIAASGLAAIAARLPWRRSAAWMPEERRG